MVGNFKLRLLLYLPEISMVNNTYWSYSSREIRRIAVRWTSMSVHKDVLQLCG